MTGAHAIFALTVMFIVQNWRAVGTVRIFEACTQMVSKTMMTVLLGINPNDPDIQKYIQAADDIVNSILSLPVNMPGFKFRKGLQAQKFIFEKVASDFRSLLDATPEEMRQKEKKCAYTSVLLSILNLAKSDEDSNITLENLQNLVLEFIFAGSQSLRCACSSMILHLSQHPEVVECLRSEIHQRGLWKKDLALVDLDEIESVQSLDKVVEETLRVTPTIPGAIRVAIKTFELGGFQIPKGWQINYSIRYTHERAAGKVLQDNGKCAFEPKINRKSQNNKSKQVETLSHGDGVQQSSMEVERTGKFSFIPFGKGARMCAGKNYGLIMLRILLFELVRTVDMQLCGESKLVEIPMTRPHDSVRIQFSSLSI